LWLLAIRIVRNKSSAKIGRKHLARAKLLARKRGLAEPDAPISATTAQFWDWQFHLRVNIAICVGLRHIIFGTYRAGTDMVIRDVRNITVATRLNSALVHSNL